MGAGGAATRERGASKGEGVVVAGGMEVTRQFLPGEPHRSTSPEISAGAATCVSRGGVAVWQVKERWLRSEKERKRVVEGAHVGGAHFCFCVKEVADAGLDIVKI